MCIRDRPNGLQLPQGASGGLLTYLGRSPGFFSSDGRRPYTQRWSFNVQVEPMKRTVMEIGYLSSRSVRQQVSTNLNALPAEHLTRSPVRDQAVIDRLSATVANPFRGLQGFEGTALFTAANTTRNQLLRPYPHFGDLGVTLPAGFSWYHALTARIDRRLSGGLLLQANYTWSSTFEALGYLNDTDSFLNRTASNLDRPHRINASGVWELPVGRGKAAFRGAPRWLDHAIGGWQTQAIWTWQLGPPLAFGNVVYTGTYDQIAMPAGQRSPERWFNVDGFDRNARNVLASNIRTFPSAIRQARAPGINIWDLSLFKNIRIGEKLRVQLRGEAEGALNHPNFAGPNVVPTNALFGTVTATQSGEGERRIFAGLKLIF